MADSNSIYCPGCRLHTSVEMRARHQPSSGEPVLYEIGECNNCSQHLLVVRNTPSGSILTTYPAALPKPVDEIVPLLVRSDLEEAAVCLTVGAIRAAATMARRSVQNICLDKGAPSRRSITSGGKPREVQNDLARQIDWLFEKRIITEELRDWAHEVRVVGNSGAHPGDAEDKEEVTRDDSEAALELAGALCSTLYIKSRLYHDRHAEDA
jgi:hypothetical protein